MNRLFFYILLAGAVGWATGCGQERKQPPPPAIEGIKIRDLEPITPMQLPQQIHFRIYTFEVPAENIPLPKELFLGLIRKPLHFADYETFEANGFFTGFGQSGMWNEISARLARAGARSAGNSRLIVFDDKGDDVIFNTLAAEQNIFYTNSEGKLVGTSLGNGRLGWRIKAKPIAKLRGACEVKLEPVFKSQQSNYIARLLGREQDNEIVFDIAEFELTMSSGDFVLIGPSQYKPDDISLGSLFFTSRGDYSLRKNVPLIRLFLIACTQVSD